MNTENENTCDNCGYFLQHYILDGDRYRYVYCGHCVHPPRTRQCKPSMMACQKWIPKPEK